MNAKALLIYFICLTLVLVFLLGLIKWHGNDIEYRHYTAIRMHACDIIRNDQSTLPEFNPERCEVRRRALWMGQMIDVSCTAQDRNGREHQFAYTYSDVHQIVDHFFERYFVASRRGYCNG